MSDDDVEFEDADSYSYNYNKDKLTFKDIILQHLKKISQFASCEFLGGYWQERTKLMGGLGVTEKFYIPDTREVYYNSIEAFADMLAPYFDKRMNEAEEKYERGQREVYEECILIWGKKEKHDLLEQKDDDERQKYVDKMKKHMVFDNEKHKLGFRNLKVKLARKLFRELCSFLYRKKYLELGAIED